MDDTDKEIRLGFLEEAKELLANTEQCFLNLEKAKDDPAIIEQIFRLAHNLKGSADAVGFSDLKDLTHKLESLLLKLKNKEIAISPYIINLLLQSNDTIVNVVEILRKDPGARHAQPELIAKIEEALEGRAPKGSNFEIVEFAADAAAAFEPVVLSQTKAPPSQAAAASADENIRVNLSKIDGLLNSVGELVILQTVLDQQKHSVASALIQKTIGQMSKIAKEIQSTSMSLRMMPVKQTFQKMQRIVRDTSKSLGKDVELTLVGEETELDKTVLEQLGDPLVHLIRNAVDHGIENPDERVQAGKPRTGQVCLSAYHRGDKIVIEIKEDGRGLDPKKLTSIAVKKGLISATDVLSDEEAYQLIFAPGFSTKTEVTDVSGRGVGMDVVRTNITQLQGDVEIETALGKGTCMRIVLPLTLAIVDSMVVRLNEDRYVIPISQITESLQPKREDISFVAESGETLNLRGETVPLYRLSSVLKKRAAAKPNAWESIALIVRNTNQAPFSILVDDIICQQQVVIKRLGDEMQGLPGVSGAAILGDGRASLILDLFEIRKVSQGQRSSLRKDAV